MKNNIRCSLQERPYLNQISVNFIDNFIFESTKFLSRNFILTGKLESTTLNYLHSAEEYFIATENVKGEIYINKYILSCRLFKAYRLKNIQSIIEILGCITMLISFARENQISQPSHQKLFAKALFFLGKIYFDNEQYFESFCVLLEAQTKLEKLLIYYPIYPKATDLLNRVKSKLEFIRMAKL